MIGRICRRIITSVYKFFNPYARTLVLYAIPRVYFKNNFHVKGNLLLFYTSFYLVCENKWFCALFLCTLK